MKKYEFLIACVLISGSLMCGGGGGGSNNDPPAEGKTISGTIDNWGTIKADGGRFVLADVYDYMSNEAVPNASLSNPSYPSDDGNFTIILPDPNLNNGYLIEATQTGWENADLNWSIESMEPGEGVKCLNALSNNYGAVIFVYNDSGSIIGELLYDKSNQEYAELQYVSGPLTVKGNSAAVLVDEGGAVTHYVKYVIDPGVSFTAGWSWLKFNEEGQNGESLANPEKINISAADLNSSISGFTWWGRSR